MCRKLILPIASVFFSFCGMGWSAEPNQNGADSRTEENQASSAGDSASEGDASEDKAWDSPERQAALKIQLFLDEQGFGPGKIDARWGGFTEKAAQRWNESDAGTKIALLEDGGLDLERVDKIPFSGNLTTSYTVTEKDSSLLGAMPEEPEEKAKLDELPYTSLIEFVAEKFHADPDLVRELNDLDPEEDLQVGSEVKIPNVAEPFELSEPMKLAEEQKKKAEEKKAEEKKQAAAEKAEEGEASDSDEKSTPYEVTILREKQTVEVRESGNLIHSFPVTPGANDNRSPAGDWKVANITWMPQFRWDKSMLEDGKRSNDAHLLPPGPNNPVGIVWIGLNADGIGMHGTPYPDAIGRNRSHGCIRLSNWDALKLGKILSTGTPVTVK